eukprot:scaffold996_cov409-Prasinococcus_capsulatus_cf.AAC.13
MASGSVRGGHPASLSSCVERAPSNFCKVVPAHRTFVPSLIASSATSALTSASGRMSLGLTLALMLVAAAAATSATSPNPGSVAGWAQHSLSGAGAVAAWVGRGSAGCAVRPGVHEGAVPRLQTQMSQMSTVVR